LDGNVYREIHDAILNMEVMPSLRLLAMAGPAARRNNLCIYNCAYLVVDCLAAFIEALIISMSGCGVGFSVEKRYVERLPRVKRQTGVYLGTFTIPDSSEGWAEALTQGLIAWMNGQDLSFDYSEIRPAGAPLMTKGGRASGPDPLRWMLDFVRETILERQGKCLRPIDAHDIMCAIGQASVCGGVRRTAMISLFDHDDDVMRHAKNGDLRKKKYRYNANNSVVLPPYQSQAEIARFMLDMDKGGNGEPGIFSRFAANNTKPARRKFGVYGINPCGESVISEPVGLCNLTMAVARPDDTFHSLKRKVELATIIGTIQSMATHFPGLRPEWKRSCEKERLLGVDLAGQMDSLVSRDPNVQRELRKHAVKVNKEYAERLGIKQSTATTVVKPSGNSSVLLGCSSGIHPWHSQYYMRNIKVNSSTPMFKVLKDAGVPMTRDNGTDWWVHFPVKAPDGAILKEDKSAIEQCEYWLQVKRNWTEHNPSVTITYKQDELLDLIEWVWEHQNEIGGMAFLPASDASYDIMPYEEITEEEYEEAIAAFPEIDFSKLYAYEKGDWTKASQVVACAGGACKL
jgi:ribonucleoside-diphosphate reductase alpha chain